MFRLFVFITIVFGLYVGIIKFWDNELDGGEVITQEVDTAQDDFDNAENKLDSSANSLENAIK